MWYIISICSCLLFSVGIARELLCMTDSDCPDLHGRCEVNPHKTYGICVPISSKSSSSSKRNVRHSQSNYAASHHDENFGGIVRNLTTSKETMRPCRKPIGNHLKMHSISRHPRGEQADQWDHMAFDLLTKHYTNIEWMGENLTVIFQPDAGNYPWWLVAVYSQPHKSSNTSNLQSTTVSSDLSKPNGEGKKQKNVSMLADFDNETSTPLLVGMLMNSLPKSFSVNESNVFSEVEHIKSNHKGAIDEKSVKHKTAFDGGEAEKSGLNMGFELVDEVDEFQARNKEKKQKKKHGDSKKNMHKKRNKIDIRGTAHSHVNREKSYKYDHKERQNTDKPQEDVDGRARHVYVRVPDLIMPFRPQYHTGYRKIKKIPISKSDDTPSSDDVIVETRNTLSQRRKRDNRDASARPVDTTPDWSETWRLLHLANNDGASPSPDNQEHLLLVRQSDNVGSLDLGSALAKLRKMMFKIFGRCAPQMRRKRSSHRKRDMNLEASVIALPNIYRGRVQEMHETKDIIEKNGKKTQYKKIEKSPVMMYYRSDPRVDPTIPLSVHSTRFRDSTSGEAIADSNSVIFPPHINRYQTFRPVELSRPISDINTDKSEIIKVKDTGNSDETLINSIKTDGNAGNEKSINEFSYTGHYSEDPIARNNKVQFSLKAGDIMTPNIHQIDAVKKESFIGGNTQLKSDINPHLDYVNTNILDHILPIGNIHTREDFKRRKTDIPSNFDKEKANDKISAVHVMYGHNQSTDDEGSADKTAIESLSSPELRDGEQAVSTSMENSTSNQTPVVENTFDSVNANKAEIRAWSEKKPNNAHELLETIPYSNREKHSRLRKKKRYKAKHEYTLRNIARDKNVESGNNRIIVQDTNDILGEMDKYLVFGEHKGFDREQNEISTACNQNKEDCRTEQLENLNQPGVLIDKLEYPIKTMNINFPSQKYRTGHVNNRYRRKSALHYGLSRRVNKLIDLDGHPILKPLFGKDYSFMGDDYIDVEGINTKMNRTPNFKLPTAGSMNRRNDHKNPVQVFKKLIRDERLHNSTSSASDEYSSSGQFHRKRNVRRSRNVPTAHSSIVKRDLLQLSPLDTDRYWPVNLLKDRVAIQDLTRDTLHGGSDNADDNEDSSEDFSVESQSQSSKDVRKEDILSNAFSFLDETATNVNKTEKAVASEHHQEVKSQHHEEGESNSQQKQESRHHQVQENKQHGKYRIPEHFFNPSLVHNDYERNVDKEQIPFEMENEEIIKQLHTSIYKEIQPKLQSVRPLIHPRDIYALKLTSRVLSNGEAIDQSDLFERNVIDEI